MANPNPTGPSTPEAGVPDNIILTRKLNQPYFEYRTPGNIDNYFISENYRVTKTETEPLARFLADVKVTQEGKNLLAHYSLRKTPKDLWRPMEYLAQSEIDAFEQATRHFYTRAHASTEKVPHDEKQLRKHFKLPDPDLERDAYWMVGDRFNPRLVILWGCEKERNTSLPLVNDPEFVAKDKPTVAQKLRQRLMPWEFQEKECLQLIAQNKERLGRFLVFPVYDKKNQLVAIQPLQPNAGQIPLKRLQKMGKLPAKEINAFQEAAQEFYAKAHPDAPASPYEKELRRNFRLPDPDRCPDAYWVYGGQFSRKLLILVKGTETKEDCLGLTPDTTLGIPVETTAPATAEDQVPDIFKQAQAEETPGTHTISDKLRLRQISIVATAIKSAVALACLALLYAAYQLFVFTPLVLKKAEVSNDPALDPDNKRMVVVASFDHAINAKSLVQPKGAGSAVPDQFVMELTTADTKKVPFKVNSVLVHKKNSRQIVIHTAEPVVENGRYSLLVRGVKPAFGRDLKTTLPIAVETRDSRPPAIKSVEAAPDSVNKVLIVFDEKVDRSSGTTPGNFAIPGFTVNTATVNEDGNIVILDAAPNFEQKAYTLKLKEISDASPNKNKLANKDIPFEYLPPPPKIYKVLANETQTAIKVAFIKKIEAASAQSLANYKLEGLTIASAKLLATGDTVELQFTNSFLRAGQKYVLAIQGIKDLAGKAGQDSREFTFDGVEDKDGPVVADLALKGKRLTVTFNEPVQGVTQPKLFTFLTQPRPDSAWELLSATFKPLSDPDKTKVHLELVEALPKGRFKLAYTNVEDAFRNPGAGEKEFKNSGGASYDISIINTKIGPDSASVILSFSGRLDPGCIRKENFSLSSGGKNLNLLEASSSYTRITIVTLKLDSKPASPSIKGEFKNLKIEGEVRLQDGTINVN